jgi:phenylacetate-coenzyme A ligase PaaK-like adenylate-forming protein
MNPTGVAPPPAQAAYAAGLDTALLTQAAWDVSMSGMLTPVQIARRAADRLRDLIAFARIKVPLYRELYRDLPEAARLADLPVIDKALVMADFGASLSDRSVRRADVDAFLADIGQVGQLFDERYAVWSSSGTSGQPGIFLHDAPALAVYEALEIFRFRGVTSLVELGARAWAGERYAMVAATGGHFAGISAVERLRSTYPWLAQSLRAFSLLQPVPALVAQLNRFQPRLLATYPTAAELLADEQEAGRLYLRLNEIWTGGECLPVTVRRRLERVFDCRVRDSYGASEFLSIAWTCRHGRLHANSDWVALEAVDADYRPVPPGTASHTVLLTNLANRIQPLIRYDLGDSITWLEEPCPCGSPLPTLKVEGRHDDVLQLEDLHGHAIKLLPLVLTTVLEEDAGVHDFQLLQIGPHTLQIRLAPAELVAAECARGALRQYLRRNGLGHVRVELSALPPQRSALSGKLRRVICTVKPYLPAHPEGVTAPVCADAAPEH